MVVQTLQDDTQQPELSYIALDSSSLLDRKNLGRTETKLTIMRFSIWPPSGAWNWLKDIDTKEERRNTGNSHAVALLLFM